MPARTHALSSNSGSRLPKPFAHPTTLLSPSILLLPHAAAPRSVDHVPPPLLSPPLLSLKGEEARSALKEGQFNWLNGYLCGS